MITGDPAEADLSLERKVGQLFLIGYPEGGEPELCRRLARRPFGNVILFSRNAAAPRPLYAALEGLRAGIVEAAGVAPIIAVDQEGGNVLRLRDGLTPQPGAMAIAAAFEGGGIGIAEVEAIAEHSARELSALGVNCNLAPVADVNVNPANPVIGPRSFGGDPAKVADLAAAYARGLARGGVMACAKHFPGHGDTTVDSHLGLPTVEAGRDRLKAVELVPFKRLFAEGIPAVMGAHVRFPAVEPEGLPATLSRRAIQSLLREELGFQGLFITDCLEMKAVHERFEEPALAAFAAGADLLCISHSAELQDRAYDAILAALRDGRVPPTRLDEAVGRILAAKARLAAPAADANAAIAALRRPEALELSRRISCASLSPCALRLDEGVPLRRDSASPTGAWLASGGWLLDPAAVGLTGAEDGESGLSLGLALRRLGSTARTIRYPLDPGDDERAAAMAELKAGLAAGDAVVFALYGMSGRPGQAALAREAAELCAERGARLAFLSMRSPYDVAACARAILEAGRKGPLRGPAGYAPPFVCAYEYGAGAAEAAAEFLHGKLDANGVCPAGAARGAPA
jgi:beta-N-acetylhexosaminidase